MARRLEVEIVGDARQYERTLQRASRDTQRFDRQVGKTFRGVAAGSGVFKTLGRSLAFASGGFIAAAGVTDLLRGSIEQASEAAAAQKQLAAQFRASGQSLTAYQTQIDDATRAVSRLAGFEDDQLTRAFTTAFRGSENVTTSLKIQAVAADVARGRHIDLQTAALALTKAFGGQTAALKRLGVQIPANLHGLAALNFVQAKFAGQARAGTTAQDRFSAAFANFEEVIGKELLPTFNNLLDSASEWLSQPENQDKVQHATKQTVGAVGNLVTAFGKVLDVTDAVGDALDEVGRKALHAGFSVQKAAERMVTGEDVGLRGAGSRTSPPGGTVSAGRRGRGGRASLSFQISLLNEQLAQAEITAGLRDDRAILVRLAALTREKIAKTKDLAKRTQLYQSLGSITEQIRAIDAKAAADRETGRQKELDAQKLAAQKAREQAAKIKAALERQKQALKDAASAVIDEMGDLFKVFVPDDPAKGILGVTGGTVSARSLTAKLKQQTDQAVRFNNELARLAKRGAPPALIAALRAQGLAGGANVHALATASQQDLNAFLRQYNRRQRVAQQIAHADIRAKTVTIVSGNIRDRATTPTSQRRGRQGGLPLGMSSLSYGPPLMTVTPLVVVLDDGGDVFTPGDPPHGVCWSPTDPALEEDPTWVRLDDPAGYQLASSYQIVRGRTSNLDKVTTGTASVIFNDTEGLLDPTNPSSPFTGQLDPMKQAAIGMMNPLTGDWHTLFRGFIAGPDHELDMWADRGHDTVTWELVDAFDLFANVVLTHGAHGHTPSLATFPNIYYQGTPSNLDTATGPEPDVFVHVDDRIVKLLDDAGWPGTGLASSTLRNIFSGNVSVQGVVYSRKDSLLSAVFDACDAEFPGIGVFFMSKEGVATFHGRYARFFPDNPGYGINHWYAGAFADAQADSDVAPLAGGIRFYRSKDDIINACYAIPRDVDETDSGVVHASDTASIAKYGYRSENFSDLLTSAGHDDDFTATTAVQECNKFSAYYVGNFKDPKTRCGTLRFTSRHPDAIGATAVWDLITRVELGDVITLTTAHPGGGGFDEDFYVEQIRYTVEPARPDMHNVTLEVEVSPSTFFAYNPFGDNDNEFS